MQNVESIKVGLIATEIVASVREIVEKSVEIENDKEFISFSYKWGIEERLAWIIFNLKMPLKNVKHFKDIFTDKNAVGDQMHNAYVFLACVSILRNFPRTKAIQYLERKGFKYTKREKRFLFSVRQVYEYRLGVKNKGKKERILSLPSMLSFPVFKSKKSEDYYEVANDVFVKFQKYNPRVTALLESSVPVDSTDLEKKERFQSIFAKYRENTLSVFQEFVMAYYSDKYEYAESIVSAIKSKKLSFPKKIEDAQMRSPYLTFDSKKEKFIRSFVEESLEDEVFIGSEHILSFNGEEARTLMNNDAAKFEEKMMQDEFKPSLCVQFITRATTISVKDFFFILQEVEKKFFNKKAKIVPYYDYLVAKYNLEPFFEEIDRPNYMNEEKNLYPPKNKDVQKSLGFQ